MLRAILRGLRADLSRLLLSTSAVVLGVAFVAGTLFFSDGLTRSLHDGAGRLDRGTDVEVSDVPADDGLVARVRAVDGVLAAEAVRTVPGIGLVAPDGARVPGFHVAGTVPRDGGLRSFDVTAGRLPDRPGEAVLDTSTVDRRGIRVGDTVRVGGRDRPATEFRVVGAVDLTGTPADIGAAFVGLVLDDVRPLTGASVQDRIVVAARPGVGHDDLAARIRTAAGPDATVRTHRQLLDAALDGAVGNAAQFRTGLLAFALVAVLVAGFVIANTFTIVLAQRSREIALLRLLGARRGQLFRSVLVESAAVGALASAAGVVLGLGIAAGIGALYGRLGSGPTVSPLPTPAAVLVSMLTGTLVTAGAALLPARRSTRVTPVEALSDAALQVTRGARRGRLVSGGVVLAAGIAVLGFAGATGNLVVVVAGGAVTFLGLVLFGPTLVPAVIRIVALPLRVRPRAPATLAVANAVRAPRRAATTAMALVIGIGLVTAFAVGARSIREGAARAVDARYGAAFVVSSLGVDLPAPLVRRLRAEPALGVVALGYYHHDDRLGADVTSADPVLLARVQPEHRGDVRDLGPGSAVVRNLPGTRPGGSVTVGGRALRVVAVLPTTPGRPEVFLTEADVTALYPDAESTIAELEPAPGVPVDRARAAVERIVADFPAVEFQDRDAFKRAQSGAIDQVLGFVTALLALAVVISLIGVANTLTLSVVERTREHALLRAVGLSTRQLRGMLAVEAVLIAVVGAVCGIAMGVGVVASAMTGISASNAGTATFRLVLPWGQLGLIVGVAAAAALLASVAPARRATRHPVVTSLASE